ncbi:hypothetical protein [Paraburkholderia youngii]|uniref:Uncharacterized protein n=1 Tax=Paraburkholderia youngii TaxID=2782701 RepID=A0A7Y6K7V1_9BURK|nr:hypothetical protein [Paraburkholderia youngii]NUY06022.1 hypothetical protein [Paraburkholderia youngii]
MDDSQIVHVPRALYDDGANQFAPWSYQVPQWNDGSIKGYEVCIRRTHIGAVFHCGMIIISCGGMQITRSGPAQDFQSVN